MSASQLVDAAILADLIDDMPSRPWKRSRPSAGPVRRRRARWGSRRFYTGRPSRFGGSVRDYAIPRGPAGAGFTGPTTTIINPTNRGFTTARTTIINAKILGASGSQQTGNLVFDPSGTYGNFHNGVSISDWGSYATIFDEYKVNMITVTVRCKPDDLIGSDSSIWMTSNRDTAVSGSLIDLQTKANVIHHTFTPENPAVKLCIVPYVFGALFNDTASIGTMTKTPLRAGWTDTETPVNMYGFLYNAVVVVGTSQSSAMYFDVEYDISWRYRSG